MSSNVILFVSEDDGSEAYYRLSASHTLTLSRVNGKRFKFMSQRIVCDDASLTVDMELGSFLHQFRYGRYTAKWDNIAQRIDTSNGEESRCLPYDYSISLYH